MKRGVAGVRGVRGVILVLLLLPLLLLLPVLPSSATSPTKWAWMRPTVPVMPPARRGETSTMTASWTSMYVTTHHGPGTATSLARTRKGHGIIVLRRYSIRIHMPFITIWAGDLKT